MPEAVIVSACRTAIGTARRGTLSDTTAFELAHAVIDESLQRSGLGNEEIGERLSISSDTVRTHIRKAMDKLEADTRTQAVATAIRRSLIA